jgi:hypothetical protein
MNDNIQIIMNKAVHDAAYLSNLKQQDIPKGIQNHSEKDLIIKSIELELQVFKDLDVYDTVSRKTIPRGAEIIYSHIVFYKKYKIDDPNSTRRMLYTKMGSEAVIKKTVYGLKDSNRAFYNLLKKTILSFTWTEKIKFEVGTAEQCLFIERIKQEKL